MGRACDPAAPATPPNGPPAMGCGSGINRPEPFRHRAPTAFLTAHDTRSCPSRLPTPGPDLRGGPRRGWMGGWSRLPQRLGAVTVGCKCHEATDKRIIVCPFTPMPHPLNVRTSFTHPMPLFRPPAACCSVPGGEDGLRAVWVDRLGSWRGPVVQYRTRWYNGPN